MADFILGIESSCDDTSAAVLRDGVLLSNVIASQQVHKDFGGVVPELASRAHEQNIVPVVSEALRRAGVKPEELTAVAFTRGPGLLGSLLVGTSFAKALSLSLGIPMVMVNHLQGHILANFIRQEGKYAAIIGYGITVSYLIILFIYACFAEAKSSYITPIREFSVVIGSILGFIFLKEKITTNKIIGIVTILLGVIMIKIG